MINEALTFLEAELRQYLRLKDIDDDTDKLDLVNLVNDKGELQSDYLSMSLVGVEEDAINKSQSIYRENSEGSFDRVMPEIRLNLYVLFAANFDSNYTEALKYLAYVIRFFQASHVFDQRNYPSLNEGIEKLIVELSSLSFEQQNHLWGTLGAKYMPSVLYKIRLLVFDQQLPESDVAPVDTTISRSGR